MRNPRSTRRRVRRGNKEWAELLLSPLSDADRRDLARHIQVTHTRLDLAWWLARLLNHEVHSET